MDSIDFIKKFPLRTFRKGEVLLSEGDTTDVVYAIQTGYIKVSSLSNDGVQRLLWIAGRYDLAPTERLFNTRGHVTFFYTALTDGNAYVIDKQTFINYAKLNADLMTEIAINMSAHYDDLLRRLDSVEQTGIREKLMHTLIYLAERFSADHIVNLTDIGLRLTHQDIAEMIGATRETTSIELLKLRKEGLIAYDRHSFTIYTERLLALIS